MQEKSSNEFSEECNKLIAKFVRKYHKNYSRKKDYKFLVKYILENWFDKFGSSLVELEILRRFSISLLENERMFSKCTEEEKYLINLTVDNLDCAIALTNSTMAMVNVIIQKL